MGVLAVVPWVLGASPEGRLDVWQIKNMEIQKIGIHCLGIEIIDYCWTHSKKDIKVYALLYYIFISKSRLYHLIIKCHLKNNSGQCLALYLER